MKKKLFVHSFKTKLGLIRLASTEKGLAVISLPDSSERYFERSIERHFSDHEIHQGGEYNKIARKQLSEYIAGKRRAFDLKLDIQGTEFHQKVLRRVAAIPYGETMTYGDVALAVGHPRASRAVGTANARNLLPFVIPCHRVVASNGIGGYGGGEHLKKRLLELEGAI
ncbi:MAG TPA: methylated-DNA--[protein]-cysteine S-methyltransferase [candidate division Zixibacteria bacterium]|nr:methylated-DNA--[protein]-cysteine S-methyltransferase [candidate division Zixibacteria bacterium]